LSVIDLVRERFAFGWYFPSEDQTVLADDPAIQSSWPVAHDDAGEPVYAPLSTAVGLPTIVCPRCVEPVWAVTRHCVERHGDADVEIQPTVPGKTPPDWFQPDWI
jgi:hypothetical protein